MLRFGKILLTLGGLLSGLSLGQCFAISFIAGNAGTKILNHNGKAGTIPAEYVLGTGKESTMEDD
jgi:hypothetical protein